MSPRAVAIAGFLSGIRFLLGFINNAAGSLGLPNLGAGALNVPFPLPVAPFPPAPQCGHIIWGNHHQMLPNYHPFSPQ